MGQANPMPSSVRDRLTCSWEALYVFVKQPRYFFDLDAIRQPHKSTALAVKAGFIRSQVREAWRGPNGDDASGLAAMKAQGRVGHPLGKNPGDVWRIASRNYPGAHHATFPVTLAPLAAPKASAAAVGRRGDAGRSALSMALPPAAPSDRAARAPPAPCPAPY